MLQLCLLVVLVMGIFAYSGPPVQLCTCLHVRLDTCLHQDVPKHMHAFHSQEPLYSAKLWNYEQHILRESSHFCTIPEKYNGIISEAIFM